VTPQSTTGQASDVKDIVIGELGLRVLAANAADAPWYLQRKAFEEKQSLLYPLIRAWGFRNFIDIGANYGFISLLARRAFPAMRVLSIEADPRIAPLIEGNFALNGLTPPEVINVIAGAECRDSVPFSLNPRSSLDNRVSMPSWEQCPIPMRTIDSILSERVVEGSCFFKVDTQGYEMQVLTGMEQHLERYSDWLIKMEFAPNWLSSQGTDPLELLRYLAQRYQIAEYPARISYDTPDLASLFDKPVGDTELESFLEYVVSLDRDGLGWVDLIVRPGAGFTAGDQAQGPGTA
jgi:FkbM family methyltransferase